MRDVFLGKPWHWLLIAAIAALMWWAGAEKLHIIHFNAFVTALLIGILFVVLLVIRTTRPDEQVTREPLVETDGEGTENQP